MRFILAIIFLVLTLPTQAAPSFNCSAKLNSVETMICQVPVLANLDVEMANRYKSVMATLIVPGKVKYQQKQWLKKLRDCDTVECIRDGYLKRLEELREAGQLGQLSSNQEYTRAKSKGELTLSIKQRVSSDIDWSLYIEASDGKTVITPGILESEDGLQLTGLDAATEYQITLREGVPLASGRTSERQVLTATTAPLKPGLDLLTGSGLIIAPNGKSPRLQYQTTGGSHLRVDVQALLPDVAMRYLQSKRLATLYYWPEDDLKQLYSETHTLTLDEYGQDQGQIKMAETKSGGAYRVMLSLCADAECERVLESKDVVTIQSHHAITALQTAESLQVSVRDFNTAMRVTQGEIKLFARNSDLLASAQIDADGWVSFPAALLAGTDGDAPGLLVHVQGEKTSYLSLKDARLDLQHLPLDGANPTTLGQAFLRTERGVYRPGEEIFIAGIARNTDQSPWNGPGLVLTVWRPDEVKLHETTLTPSNQGLLHHSVSLGPTAKRGEYRIELSLNDAILGSTRFQIQDYVPETMEVTLDGLPDVIALDQGLTLTTQSDFLFGAPAADRPISARISAKPSRRPFSNHPKFEFGRIPEDTSGSIFIGDQELTTNSIGAAEFFFAPTDLSDLKNLGQPHLMDLRIELEELSGRLTRQSANALISTQPVWIGVRPTNTNQWWPESQPAGFSVIALDSETQTVTANSVTWRVIEEDWDYFWTRRDNGWDYQIEYYPMGTVADGKLNLDGTTPLQIPNLSYGRYKLEITPENGQPTEYRFQIGWWAEDGPSSAVPDRLDLVLSNPTPGLNEPVTIQLNAPFDGVAEVMVVNDGISQVHNVQIVDRKGELTITPPTSNDQWYLLATGFRVGDVSQPGPSRAMGIAHLSIAPDRFKKEATLQLPEVARPNAPLTFTVLVPDAADGAEIVVTAVDVGVLNLTRHPTANPFSKFTAKRALDIAAYDPYGFIARYFAELTGTNISIGGDTAVDSSGSPTFFDTLALQSEPVIVQDGQAQVSFDLEQLNGRLRIDVLGGDGIASIQGVDSVEVRDVVAVTAALPRIVAPRDQFVAGVGLTLTEPVQGPIQAEWRATGSIQTLSESEALNFENPGETQQLQIPVDVIEAGFGSLQLVLTRPTGETQNFVWTIESRLPGPVTAKIQRFELPPGSKRKLPMSVMNAFENPVGSLQVSSTPLPQSAAIAKDLINYRYACLEQTVSKTWPWLISPADELNADLTVQMDTLARAYRRLADLQQASGLFVLWPWRQNSESWLSLYAIDFLRQPIPTALKDHKDFNEIERLRTRLLTTAAENLPRLSRNSNPSIKAYALLLRAQAGDADPGEMRYLLQTQDDISSGALAQLAQAFAVTGDKTRALQAFERATATPRNIWNYQSYTSPIRDTALLAYAANAAGLSDYSKWAVDKLDQQTAERSWLSTQEQVWIYRVVSEQPIVEAGQNTWTLSNSVRPEALTLDDKGITITNHGTATLYVSLAAQGSLRLDRNSLFDTDSAIIDNPALNLTHRYQVFDTELGNNYVDHDDFETITMRQGQWLIIQIGVEVDSKVSRGEWLVENLAAGGLEVENPQLGGLEVNDLLEQAGVDFGYYGDFEAIYLDDRLTGVITPSDFDSKRFDEGAIGIVSSVWRAVTPGTFRLPGVYVENMLDPNLNGATAELVLNVVAD